MCALARRWGQICRAGMLVMLALATGAVAPVAPAAPAAPPPSQPSLPPLLHLERAEVLQVDSAIAEMAPAQVDSRALPGTWRPLALPYAQPSDLLRQASDAPAGDAPMRGALVTLWYRIAVPAFAPPPEALMLYAARLKAHGPIAVYIDGQLRYQRQLDGPNWYWDPLWLAVDGGQRAAPPREILLRMQQPRALRSALASVWLGPADAIGWRFQARQWLQIYLPVMSNGAFLAVGVFSFVVWCRRGGAGFGFFAVLALAQFVRSLSFFGAVRMSNDWFSWCMLNSLFWSIVIGHAFQVYMHGRRQPRISAGLITVALCVGVFSLPPLASGGNTPLLTPLIYVLAIVCGAVVCVAGLHAGWRRSNEALALSAGVALGVLYGINDWALQSNFLGPENWYLGPYINLQNFVMLCWLIYRRYIGAQVAVEQSNAALSQRLLQREAELALSYQRLRQIEHTQTLATERQRLTQDMHDGLGSSLHTALRAIEGGQLNTESVSEILRSCIDDLHLTIDSLEPVEADLLLLLATLRYRLGDRLHNAGIALRWEVVDVPALAWIDPRTALHILRILQEALTNIIKHTAATEITVFTACEGDGVCVGIADNGGGFDLASAIARGGKGLLNQQRRVAALGGAIRWQARGAGTCVTLWLPRSRNAVPA